MRALLKQNPLPAVIFTVFVDMLGIGILLPVMPRLLADPTSEYYLLPAGMSIQTGFIILGFLTASFTLAQFFAAPILGQLSDRYGRKPVLAISLFGTALSYVMFAIGILIANIPLLFFSRIVGGITGGNIAVAQAAIADVTTPQNRVKNFGLIGAAFGFGFIIGPYIGGKLSDPTVLPWFSAATPFWFAAILSFLNMFSVLFFFPETHQHKNLSLVINWTKSIKNIISAYAMKEVRTIFATNVLFQGGFAFYTSFAAVFYIERYHFTQGNIGDFFAYIGVWIALTQAVLTRRLSGKFREYHILRVTLLGCGIGILLYYLTNAAWQLYIIAPFFAICMGLSQANIAGLISRSVSPAVQGEILGINASVQALAQSIPPMLSGFIAAKMTPESPIVVSFLVIALAWLVFVTTYRPTQSPLSADARS